MDVVQLILFMVDSLAPLAQKALMIVTSMTTVPCIRMKNVIQ
jgi:hypothetical protein